MGGCQADSAHAAGARLGVDSTAATPVHTTPVALGADLVAYSAENCGQFDLELHGQIGAAINLGKSGNSGGGRGIPLLPSFRSARIEV